MIEFSDADGVIGTVDYVDGELRASNSARNIVDSWLRHGRSANDFEAAYDGWSNGYVNGRRVDDAVVAATFHLPGRHEQKKHGNRRGKPSTPTGDSADGSNSAPKTEDSFARRMANATTGAAVGDSVTIRDEDSLHAVASEGHLNGRSIGSITNSIDEYQTLAYEDINDHLRSNDGDLAGADDEVVTYTRDIDAIMQSSQLSEDALVYRGIWSAPTTFGSAWQRDGDNTGLTWEDQAFVSTSTDGKIIERISNATTNSNGVNMRVLVPRGTHAIGIDPSSAESEFLLNRGRRFRVARDYTRDGARWLDVEVIN